MNSHHTVLIGLWQALNARDLDAATALLHPDVEWFDMLNEEWLHGAQAVRGFWERAFGLIKARSTLLNVETDDEDRIHVTVLHAVSSIADRPWTEEKVTHIYSFRDNLISRMDVQ